MKFAKRMISVAVLAMALTILLPACSPSRPPEETVGGPAEANPGIEIELPSEEDRALADRAAEILWTEYDLPERTHFDEDVSHHVSNGRASVRFTLRIGRYRTSESYAVYFEADGSILRVVDVSGGEYSRFLENATPACLSAAEAALAEQLKHYEEHSDYYLGIDESGCLCLSAEVIVKLNPPPWEKDGGCGIDHEHKFFNQRIGSARESRVERSIS